MRYKENRYKIYCDGGSRGNPGPSGSGVVIYKNSEVTSMLYGGYLPKATNNIAELNAMWKALSVAKELDSSNVEIYSDSSYTIDSVTRWAYNWRRNKWKRRNGDVANKELVKAVFELYLEVKEKVVIKHVRGHVGIEGNELADAMANMAIDRKSIGYLEYK